MYAVPEGDMRIMRARDIEAIRVRELGSVSVGGVCEGKNSLPLLKHFTAELDIVDDDASEGPTWAIIPQPFLDSRSDEIEVVDEALPLIPIPH